MCGNKPLVIVSAQIGEPICNQYSINLRNLKEFIDGVNIFQKIINKITTYIKIVFQGLLEPLQEETFLIYKQIDKESNYSQVGILAALDIEDCKSGKIKKHEKTTKDVDDICSEKIKNYRVII